MATERTVGGGGKSSSKHKSPKYLGVKAGADARMEEADKFYDKQDQAWKRYIDSDGTDRKALAASTVAFDKAQAAYDDIHKSIKDATSPDIKKRLKSMEGLSVNRTVKREVGAAPGLLGRGSRTPTGALKQEARRPKDFGQGMPVKKAAKKKVVKREVGVAPGILARTRKEGPSTGAKQQRAPRPKDFGQGKPVKTVKKAKKAVNRTGLRRRRSLRP
jgi:hypothetical protein